MERRFFGFVLFCFVLFCFFFFFFFPFDRSGNILQNLAWQNLSANTSKSIGCYCRNFSFGAFEVSFFFFPEVSKTYFQGLESMVLCFRCRSIRYFQLCYCQHKLVSFVLLIELLHRLRAQSLSLIYFSRR